MTKHGTLKTTPAVAAGIASQQWTVGELIERTASYDPPKPLTGLAGFIDGLPEE